MSRRLEPDEDDDGEDGGFFDSPLGWLVTLVAIGVFVGVFMLSELAAVAIALSLLGAELVDQRRKRGRPWLVEANADGAEPPLVWRVKGRRRSREVEGEIMQALERGHSDISPTGAARL